MLPPNYYNPQCVRGHRPLLMWTVLAGGALLLVGLVIAAPLAQANGYRFLAVALYEAFSHLCHQQSERSFYIAGLQVAVCARCTGLYGGFAAATLLYPLLTSLRRTHPPQTKWLFFAAAPLAFDFGLGFLGIWENTHSSRFLTGALLGAVAVFYVMPGLAELSQRLRSRSSSEPEVRQTSDSTPTAERIATPPSDYSAPLRRI